MAAHLLMAFDRITEARRFAPGAAGRRYNDAAMTRERTDSGTDADLLAGQLASPIPGVNLG
jgi:hypothetical protein